MKKIVIENFNASAQIVEISVQDDQGVILAGPKNVDGKLTIKGEACDVNIHIDAFLIREFLV